MLWKIIRPLGVKWGNVTGERSRLHSFELYDLYCSPKSFGWSNQKAWVGLASVGERRDAYKALVGRPRFHV